MIYKQNKYPTQKSYSNAKSSIFLILFAIFYPTLFSIYMVIPLFVGLAGYFLLIGIKNDNKMIMFISSLYLLNLDINTSMPLFSSIMATLLCYLFVLPRLKIIQNCRICISAIVVSSIYVAYYLIAYLFCFTFELMTVELSMLFLISIILDIILVAMI